jgi:hypothetical protein
MHVVAEGDHIWSLDSQAKQNLSDAIAKGIALAGCGKTTARLNNAVQASRLL